MMKCIVCKNGDTEPGNVTVSVDKHDTVVVIRDVPAQVCATCGEEYIDAQTMKQIEKLVESAQKAGMNFAVQHYHAA
ncbi:MAG: type II toxin-antitoxin system MqsA family antitoxin [Deltaproteobacteria bacterium]|nr:type II toxin-antitoxin system MqsA family antitoxin [Deltaproteobacteria bacterium]